MLTGRLGGYLSALSAFRPVSSPLIRATIVLAYPIFDMHSPWFTECFERHPFGQTKQPSSLVSDHFAATEPGITVGAVDTPARLELAVTIIQQGRISELLGDGTKMYPMELLEQYRVFPSCFIYHGL